MTESSTLRTKLDDGALLVELNRPEKRNAFDGALQGELLRVFTDAADEREVRGVILSAAGEAFSAGGDLSASVDIESGLFAESLAQSQLVGTEDHREGVRAARERRAPSFTGR
jgi:enoyl-CoA hydratase/carnithine racemase